MTKAMVLLCCGMPKSGSTLAFDLSRLIAEQAGSPPDPIGELITDKGVRTNECRALSHDLLSHLRQRAANEDRLLVVYSYAAPTQAVAAAMAEGWLKAVAVCRDPRDVALSMVDQGQVGPEWGAWAGQRIMRPDDVRDLVRSHVAQFEAWMKLPGIVYFNYERVAFDIRGAVRTIAGHVGVRIWPRLTEMRYRWRSTGGRRQKARRYLTEMNFETSASWEQDFRDFITTYCADVPERHGEDRRRRKRHRQRSSLR